jgi:endonuclease YncB( thermonuclease family)
VIQVIDGDSIEVRLPNGTNDVVRYVGIDAPDEESPLVEAARGRNSVLVQGKELWLEVEPEGEGFLRDRDGRVLSWVFAGTLQTAPVQVALVRGGLGMLDVREVVDRELATGCFPVRYWDSLLEAQLEAAFDRRGLWGLPPFCPDVDLLMAGIKHWGDVEEVYLINRGTEAVDLTADWVLMDESAYHRRLEGKIGRNQIRFAEAFGPNCSLPRGGILVIRTGPGIPEFERKTPRECGTSRVVLNWFGYKMWNGEGDAAYLYQGDKIECVFRYPWQERAP